MQHANKNRQSELVERCLAAFVKAGTIDLSLDQLANQVGVSKRMLVHYFGDRGSLEEQAMTLLEERLRAQFAKVLATMNERCFQSCLTRTTESCPTKTWHQ